jgi:hypothetical protein
VHIADALVTAWPQVQTEHVMTEEYASTGDANYEAIVIRDH